MDWTPFTHLVQSGGPVLVAVVVVAAMMGGMVYLGHRYIYMPAQRMTKAISEANAQAAEAHAFAAAANQEAAKYNSETSLGNARTAAHLERLTEMLLTAAIGQKNS